MRYLYVLVGLAVLLSIASAAGGNFKAVMDVGTYVDASNANTSFSDSDTLYVTSADGKPVKETYLSYVNNFGSAGIFKPDAVKSATLKLYAKNVEKPGMIKAYLVHGATLDTATWNDKPEYESSVSASMDIQKDGEYSIDVTSLIKKAVEICTEGCPYSIAIVAEDNASMEFSKNASEKPSLEYTTA